jgi:hypothetical protein
LFDHQSPTPDQIRKLYVTGVNSGKLLAMIPRRYKADGKQEQPHE